MYKVIIKTWINDHKKVSCSEYSGIEHQTIAEANKEYLEALEKNIDNEAILGIIVEEF